MILLHWRQEAAVATAKFKVHEERDALFEEALNAAEEIARRSAERAEAAETSAVQAAKKAAAAAAAASESKSSVSMRPIDAGNDKVRKESPTIAEDPHQNGAQVLTAWATPPASLSPAPPLGPGQPRWTSLGPDGRPLSPAVHRVVSTSALERPPSVAIFGPLAGPHTLSNWSAGRQPLQKVAANGSVAASPSGKAQSALEGALNGSLKSPASISTAPTLGVLTSPPGSRITVGTSPPPHSYGYAGVHQAAPVPNGLRQSSPGRYPASPAFAWQGPAHLQGSAVTAGAPINSPPAPHPTSYRTLSPSSAQGAWQAPGRVVMMTTPNGSMRPRPL